MVNGLSKTDKLHLFDDRNLKALAKLYHWAGPKRQKDLKEKKNKKRDLEEFDEEVRDESFNTVDHLSFFFRWMKKRMKIEMKFVV